MKNQKIQNFFKKESDKKSLSLVTKIQLIISLVPIILFWLLPAVSLWQGHDLSGIAFLFLIIYPFYLLFIISDIIITFFLLLRTENDIFIMFILSVIFSTFAFLPIIYNALLFFSRIPVSENDLIVLLYYFLFIIDIIITIYILFKRGEKDKILSIISIILAMSLIFYMDLYGIYYH